MTGRGGRRPGAGRPRGTGKYGEPTKAVRVPEQMVEVLPELIARWQADRSDRLSGVGSAAIAGPRSPERSVADQPGAGWDTPADLGSHLDQDPISAEPWYVNPQPGPGSIATLNATLNPIAHLKRGRRTDETTFVAELATQAETQPLEWVESLVAAGLSVPADDRSGHQDEIDLNLHLSRHPQATFVVKVTGESMVEAGIQPGNLLVVDRLEEPTNGRIVVALVEGRMTVKRLQIMDNRIFLKAENSDRDNPDYRTIAVGEHSQFEIVGVVVSIIQPLVRF